MKKRVKEIVKRVFFGLNLLAMNIALGIPVYAAKDETTDKTNKILHSTFVQGLIALAQDSTLAILAIEAVALALIEGVILLMYQFGAEEQKTKRVSQAKNVALVGGIIMGLTGTGGLVAVILSYFTPPAAAA